jgi:hypothetical protein
VLPGFGYSSDQIQIISQMLLATELPQAPLTLAEQILADADLDVLGREDYWDRSRALRAEWEFFGLKVGDEEWYRSQLDFLQRHRYFTVSARRLRQPLKQRHMAQLRALLRQVAQAPGS